VITKLHYPPRNIPPAPIRQEAGRVPEVIWMGNASLYGECKASCFPIISHCNEWAVRVYLLLCYYAVSHVYFNY